MLNSIGDPPRIPLAVLNHKFRIRSLNGHNIKFVMGYTVHPDTLPAPGRSLAAAVGGEGAAYGQKGKRVPQVIEYDAPEASLPFVEAWRCMSQHGKMCVRGTHTKEQQNRNWLYEEVLATDDERPRKAK